MVIAKTKVAITRNMPVAIDLKFLLFIITCFKFSVKVLFHMLYKNGLSVNDPFMNVKLAFRQIREKLKAISNTNKRWI